MDGTMGICEIIATMAGGSVEAALDYHGKDAPSWNGHTVFYTVKSSVELDLWMTNDGKRMDHKDFCKFVEDNLPDISDPPSIVMLESISALELVKTVNIESMHQDRSGDHKAVVIQNTGGKNGGKISIPEVISLTIPVFHEGKKYTFLAKICFRADEKTGVQLYYELQRPDKVVEQAQDDLLAEVQRATDIKPLKGALV